MRHLIYTVGPNPVKNLSLSCQQAIQEWEFCALLNHMERWQQGGGQVRGNICCLPRLTAVLDFVIQHVPYSRGHPVPQTDCCCRLALTFHAPWCLAQYPGIHQGRKRTEVFHKIYDPVLQPKKSSNRCSMGLWPTFPGSFWDACALRFECRIAIGLTWQVWCDGVTDAKILGCEKIKPPHPIANWYIRDFSWIKRERISVIIRKNHSIINCQR